MVEEINKELNSPAVKGLIVAPEPTKPHRFAKLRARSRKAKLIIAAVVVLVVVGIVGGYAYYRYSTASHIKTSLSKKDISNIPVHDYEGMTQKEAQYQIQADTGHSFHDLQTKPIGDKLLSNFEAAFDAARGFMRLGETAKSLQAYAVAAKKAPADNYLFHVEYGYAAITGNQDDIARQQSAEVKVAAAKGHLSAGELDTANRQAAAILQTITEPAL